jgi:outer membrane protein TolC
MKPVSFKFFLIVFAVFFSAAYSADSRRGELTYYQSNLGEGVDDLILNDSIPSLTMQEAMRLALDNSLDIQIAKFDAYISRTSLGGVKSIFDTFLSAGISFSRDRREQSSIILGTESKSHTFFLGAGKKVASGTTLTFEATGRKQRTDSAFTSFNPYNEALAGVSLRQELGKNFFGMADRGKIKITKLDIENSQFTSLDDIENIFYQTQKAYWTLALRDRELAIAAGMLKEARKLYDTYSDKFDIGLAEDGDLFAIEALVFQRENSLILTAAAREAAKNDLLFLLNKPYYSHNFRAADALETAPVEIILDEQIREAMAFRRDYQRIKNDLAANNIAVAVNKNALWPEIDLEASFKRNNLNARRARAWSEIPGENSDELFVGLTVTLSLENSQARAELERVNLEKEQLLFRFKRIERSILKDLTNSASRLSALAKSIDSHKRIVKLHRQKLDFQIKRLGQGRSNFDTLIRYEEDLFAARRDLAMAFYEYRVALSELALTKNTLLDDYWKDSF